MEFEGEGSIFSRVQPSAEHELPRLIRNPVNVESLCPVVQKRQQRRRRLLASAVHLGQQRIVGAELVETAAALLPGNLSFFTFLKVSWCTFANVDLYR